MEKSCYLCGTELEEADVDRPLGERKRQEKISVLLGLQRLPSRQTCYPGHSGGTKVDPSLQDNVDIPYNWIDYIYHVWFFS